MTIPTPTEFWTFNNTLVGINGNTLVSPDGLGHFVPGKIGEAWDVADASNRVLRQLSSPINPGPYASWSFSIWFYTATGQATIGRLFELRDGSISKLSIGLYQVSICPASFFSDQWNLQVGWNHLCVTATYGEPDFPEYVFVRMFLNGIISNWNEENVGVLPDLAMPNMYLGGTGASTGVLAAFESAVDSAGWWDVALSADDCAELYNSGLGWEPSTADVTPDTFDFTDIADADLSTEYISSSQTITGMDAGTVISVTNGEYRLDGVVWTSDSGVINPGQILELRTTSSNLYSTLKTVSITIGDTTVDWNITTKTEIIYSIQNISSISQTIENGSVVIKCGGSGGLNLIVKHLSRNPSELTINNIQDKFNNKFDDPNYYWTKQNG